MTKREIPAFYKQLWVLVLPITLQYLVSALVNSVDVLMLNYVSQSAIAAVSLANQVMFILSMFVAGLSSGVSMLAAQYWGKNDTDTIEKILGIGLRFAIPIAACITLSTLFWPEGIMRIFTSDPNLIALGADYLRILSVSYFFMGISQMYLCMMRSVERAKFAMLTTTSAVLINILLNAGFIFGLAGMPKLGLHGVALATTIARTIELLVCIIDNRMDHPVHMKFKTMFMKNALLFKDFVKYSGPAVGNECVWGVAFTCYAVIMGHLNEDIVAANSVVTVIRELFSVVGFGIAYGGAIILGKTIGEGKLEQAREDAHRLIWTAFWSGVIGGILLLLLRPFSAIFSSLSPTANSYLQSMLLISSYYLIGAILNTTFICGIFRAGGDSKFGFICDIIAMWCVMLPVGFIAAFVLKLPPLVVYFILCLDEFIKMPVVIKHYRDGKWLQNITRDFPEGKEHQ